MSDPTPLYSDGVLLNIPELAGRHLRVVAGEQPGTKRLADPMDDDAWLEIDADALVEVGGR